MLNLKELSEKELNNLLKEIKEELETRNNKKVIYNCDAKGKSEYALRKYKNWAKVLAGIDNTQTNGFAFIGSFLNIRTENLVAKNSYVVELEDDNQYHLYKVVDNNNKELLLEGSKSKLISFIQECKKIIEA